MSSRDMEHHGSKNHSHHDSAKSVLDMRVMDELRELGGEDDPGLIAELIEIYLTDAPQRLADISQGLSSGDIKIVERAAHTLKSSSANIGAIELSKLCREMEQVARDRKLEAIPPLFTRSKEALSEVQSALRAIKA